MKALEKTFEVPKVLPVRWQWKHGFIRAYQLPNGMLVMSDSQMAFPARQYSKAAKEFVIKRNLNTVLVQLPNHKLAYFNTLATVATYWKHLLASGEMPESINSTTDWENLIKALEDASLHPNIKLRLLPRLDENHEVSVKAREPVSISAQPLLLNLQMNSKATLRLEVLALSTGEYRISQLSGLAAVGAFSNWLSELNNSSRKLNALRKRGFEGKTVTCHIHTPTGRRTLVTLSVDDWLTIWEYFANRGNTKATAILKACAKESIPRRAAAAM